MRASRSYEAQHLRLTMKIDALRPGQRADAALEAGDFAEHERWTGLYLADENTEMNVTDWIGHAPSSPADWKRMVQGLHMVLDGHGFVFRKGNRLVDVVAERAERERRIYGDPEEQGES